MRGGERWVDSKAAWNIERGLSERSMWGLWRLTLAPMLAVAVGVLLLVQDSESAVSTVTLPFIDFG